MVRSYTTHFAIFSWQTSWIAFWLAKPTATNRSARRTGWRLTLTCKVRSYSAQPPLNHTAFRRHSCMCLAAYHVQETVVGQLAGRLTCTSTYRRTSAHTHAPRPTLNSELLPQPLGPISITLRPGTTSSVSSRNRGWPAHTCATVRKCVLLLHVCTPPASAPGTEAGLCS